MSDAPRRPAGFLLYLAAFACLLVAGGLLAVAAKSFLSSFTPLWLSVGSSVVAALLAAAALVRSKRS